MTITSTPDPFGSRPGRWECVYVVVVMSIYHAIPFLVGDQPDGAESLNPIKALKAMSTHGDAIKQLLLLGIYLFFLVVTLLTTHWRSWSFLGLPMIMLGGFGPVSMLWSIAPSVTLRRSVAMLGTVLLGTYLGLRFDLRTFLRLMSWVIAIILISSIVIALAWPNSGLDYEGRLRGVTAHKNALSGIASVSFLIIVTQLTMLKQNDWLTTLGHTGLAFLCIAIMIWSESAAAIPILLLSLPLLFLTAVLRKADRRITATFPVLLGLAALLVVLVVDNADTIAQMLGKNSDISGRTWVWTYAINKFLERPWLGYGLGTFWEGFNSPGGVFWSVTGLGVPHSHNGYIQLALDAGIVGLALMTATVLALVYRLAWLVKYGDDRLIGWCVAFLGLFLVSNLAETRLWIGNQPFTEFFIYIVVYTNLQVWRTLNKARGYAPPVQPVLARELSGGARA